MPVPISVGDVSSQLALDANALDKLKHQAKSDPGKALAAAAGQFEALFMQMLLKSMREALPQDGPLASDTTKSYTAMFDQQIAQQLSKKGIGVADMLVKQLSKALPHGDGANDATAGPAPLDKARSAPALRSAASAPLALPTRAPAPEAPLSSAASRGASAVTAAVGSVSDTVHGFVEKLRPYAESVAQKLGVPVQYLIAQAGLETGWGKSLPRAADGTPSHNLFGVKATPGWKGASVSSGTSEYDAGRMQRTSASFRAYASYGDSLRDFANLLQTSRRYAGALANTHDASKYAASLQQAGYATDPRYAEKLARAIQMVSHVAPAAPSAKVASAAADIPSESA